MKAIIMAGGEGSRLRPLTCDKPKPLMPVLDKPLMRYAIDLLHKHGIYDIAATISYRGNLLREAFSNDVIFFEEKMALGTAGSIKNAEAFLNAPFVVLSGDALTDVDLKGAIDFHKKNNAVATLVLKRVENPLDYGVVLTDKKGRIKRFVEKPDWKHVLSDNVNTGIYILDDRIMDLIPENTVYDFGSQLFPKLVKEGYPVYGYVTNGYWCDIGDIKSYISAHQDMLKGRVSLNYSTQKNTDANISKDAIIEGPCYIGAGSFIEAGAHISSGSVIGKNVFVGRNANINESIIWDGAHIGEGTSVNRCVVMDRATVKMGSLVCEGACIGSGAVIGNNAHIHPFVNVWPDQFIAEDSQVFRSVVNSNAVALKNDEGMFTCAMIPEEAAAIGAAFVCTAGIDSVCIGYESEGAAQMLADAFLTGAMSMGAQVRKAENVNLPALVYSSIITDSDACAHFSNCGNEIRIKMYINGMDISFDKLRRIMNAYSRLDRARCVAANIKPQMSRINAQSSFEEWKKTIIGDNKAFIMYEIKDDTPVLYDESGLMINEDTFKCILDEALGYYEKGNSLMSIISKQDPKFAVDIIAGFLSENNKTLRHMAHKHSRFTKTAFAECPNKAKGAVMRLIGEQLDCFESDDDGLIYCKNNGIVHIRPSRVKGCIELVSGASDQEFAQELIADCQSIIKGITEKMNK